MKIIGKGMMIVIAIALSMFFTIENVFADLLQMTFTGDVEFAQDAGTLLGETTISDKSIFVSVFTFETGTAPYLTETNYSEYSLSSFSISFDGLHTYSPVEQEARVTN